MKDELPITMSEEFTFDWVLRLIWTGLAWLGFFTLIFGMCFFFGMKV